MTDQTKEEFASALGNSGLGGFGDFLFQSLANMEERIKRLEMVLIETSTDNEPAKKKKKNGKA